MPGTMSEEKKLALNNLTNWVLARKLEHQCCSDRGLILRNRKGH